MTPLQPLSPGRSPVDAPASTPVDGAGADDGAPLLPTPTAGLFGGAIADLAMLLTEADEQDRRESRAVESAADEAAMADARQRAQDLRDKASAQETAGILEGAGMMAGGVASLGAELTAPTPAASTNAPSSGAALHALLSGVGPAAQGLGKTGSAVFAGVAGGADADAAWKQAAADAQTRRFNSANQEEQAAAAAIQRVEQWLDTVQQTESATRLTAAGRA